MSNATRLVALVVLAALILAGPSPVQTAPAPKPLADEIVGEFDFSSLQSPTVTVHYQGKDGEIGSIVYWLVFTNRSVANKVSQIDARTRVKATGQLGHGGGYHYLICTDVVSDHD